MATIPMNHYEGCLLLHLLCFPSMLFKMIKIWYSYLLSGYLWHVLQVTPMLSTM